MRTQTSYKRAYTNTCYFDSAIIKILYLDEHYAVTYECDEIQPDGICEMHHKHLFVLTRARVSDLSECYLGISYIAHVCYVIMCNGDTNFDVFVIHSIPE